MKTAIKPQTLEEFVDHPERQIVSIWLVSTANPAGIEYRHNIESNGEDYCDCLELLCTYNLSPTYLLALNGQVDRGVWTWDGKRRVKDYAGNSIVTLKVKGSDAQ